MVIEMAHQLLSSLEKLLHTNFPSITVTICKTTQQRHAILMRFATSIKKWDYRIDRGIRTTSRQISFEFLFIKTRPLDKLPNGFGFVVQFRVGIRYVICQGGEF
jgi:hypothetical protein